jgi:outer membrane protein insertion porin family
MMWATAVFLWWLAGLPPAGAVPGGRSEFATITVIGDVPASIAQPAASAAYPFAWRRLQGQLSSELSSLARSGYLDATASVSAVESESLHITAEIVRGKRWRWGSIAVDARPVVPLPDVGEPLGRLRGRECTLSTLEDAVFDILDVYDRHGYPFAQVRVESLSGREGVLDAALAVTEGPLVRWGDLRLVGTKKTKTATAARIIGFESGEPFDSGLLRGARPRMLTSGLFSRVANPILRAGPTSDMVDVEIEATEARTSSVAGTAGYVPARGEAKGYFVGSVELSLENMAGTGRSGAFSWRRTAPGVSTMSVGYREPWLLGSPFSVRVRLVQEVHDTTYTMRRGEVEVGMLVGDRLEASVGAAGERITPAESAQEALATYVKYEGSVRMRWEGRDSRVLAERGWFADAFVSYGRRRSQADSADHNIPEATVQVSSEVYIPAGRRRVLALAAGAKVLVSDADRLPVPLQFPLGGATDVRGYREQQFRGAQVAWLSIDPWILRWPQGAFGPFVDLGYYHLAASRGGTGGHAKVGYGIALRSLTRIGVLSVDYGIGEDTGPLDGRIHVALKALF